MDEQVADFISLTGASADEANQYLEMANYDSELAANLFWDMGNNPSQSNPSRAANPVIPIDDFEDDSAVRQPIEARVDRLIDFSQPFQEISDHSDSEYLFAPPLSAGNVGVSFQSLLARAKAANKLVLACLQDPEVFASHILNRDVWPDEILSEILAQNFEFFLRDKNSADGRAFAALYRIEKFPTVAIIDSRTGRLLKKFERVPDAAFLVEQLTVFLDRLAIGGMAAGIAVQTERQAVPEAAPLSPPPPISPTKVATLPEFPPAGTAGTVRLAIRLGSGMREQISVYPETRLSTLVQWAAAREGVEIECVELKTAPPVVKGVKSDFDDDATVQDAGLAGALLTVVKVV